MASPPLSPTDASLAHASVGVLVCVLLAVGGEIEPHHVKGPAAQVYMISKMFSQKVSTST